MEIREFLDDQGRSPFRFWFEGLDSMAAIKVTTAITRMSLGNFSNAKGVGDGDRLIILVAGGTKKRQQADIKMAHKRWADYRKRKAG